MYSLPGLVLNLKNIKLNLEIQLKLADGENTQQAI